MIRLRPSPSACASRIRRWRSWEAATGFGIGPCSRTHRLVPGALQRPGGGQADDAGADHDHAHDGNLPR